MEEDINQLKALLEDVEEAKNALNVSSTDALLLMIYDRLLDMD